MKKYTIFNCHIHTFTENDVPRRFLPFGLVPIISSRVGYFTVANLLKVFNPITPDDMFKKYLQFVDIGKLGSQKDIFEKCAIQYPVDTKYIVMSIDMEYMNAGRVPNPYKNQLEELSQLSQEDDRVIPFIHVDPRRPNIFNIFQDYIEKGFKGIKLYPPQGHIVEDDELLPIYEYCNEHSIPMLVHCGEQSPTRYRGTKRRIRKMLDKFGVPWNRKMNKAELCAQLTYPMFYIPLLEKYPNMKICLGHWGSEISWKEYLENPGNKENWFYLIMEMLKAYPNLYTDISFTLNNQEFFSVLKVFLQDKRIQDKVLFGSDYYMVRTKTTEKRFGFDLRAFLGEDLFKKIAHDNPKKFLKY